MERGETGQLGVEVVVDAGGDGTLPQQGIGEGQADDVVAMLLDVIEEAGPVAGPQAVRGEVGGLEAEPVDAAEGDGLAGCIEDLGAGGMQAGIVGCLCHGRFGYA